MDPNWNAAQGGASNGPGSGAGSDPNGNLDWRSQLQPDARQRIVNKIMDTLKRHLPVPVPDGLSELQKIAVRFEEKIYGAATSQPDYLRKISLKMLSMETKTQQPGLNPALPNQNRIDTGVGMTAQQAGPNPSQSIGMAQSLTQPPVSRQQQQQSLLQGSPNMPSSVGGGPNGATMPPMSGPSMSNSNPMSVPGGTSGPGGPTGSIPTDMYSNTQRRQPPQQLTSQNQIMYQQQLAMQRQKLQQQQQQSLLQQTQMQMSSALAGGSGMMSAIPTGGMQQTQMNAVQQQPVGQGGSLQQQSLMRQQQQQPQPTMQNPNIPMQQTNSVTDLQQQRLQMQQNQLQQNQMQQTNNVTDLQQQRLQMQQNQMQQNQMQQSQMQQNQMQQSQMQQNQMQQSQMQQNQMQQSQMQQNQLQQNQLQQNQLQSNQMHQSQSLNQQMMLNQQQNQLLGSASAGNMNNMQRMQMQRQAGMLQQQQPQQQQHLLSQLQSQQQQMPQQQLQPQQQQPSMMQQREMQMPQQRMQNSPALLQMQNSNVIDPQRQQQQQFISQQQQPLQQQRVLQDVASSPASMDSTAQTGHQGDFQEEMYQRIKYLKDTYFNDLRDMHQKLSMKLSQVDSIPTNARSGDQIERMKNFKTVLERMMAVLQLGKQSIHIGLKDKLSLYEKQIVNILQNNKKVPQQQSQGGGPDQQHFAPPQPGLQSQQPPQQHQPQQMDNHPNQLQQQLSNNAMPQSNNIGITNATQQGMQNVLQDQIQASSTGFGSLQQGSMGSTMQNSMNPPQMVGSGTGIGSSNLSHTGTMTGMTPNMNAAQVLKQQQQQQEQQIQPQQRMMPTQQQMQQRHFHQRLMQQQKQQLLQQQLPLQQQVQQQKQLQPQNQMQQLGQPSDPADLKLRQGAAGMKPGAMYQQQYPGVGPRNSYYHSQVKPGSNLPISSPQNIQSSSPQISHPSPQVDQHGLIPPSQLKSGTPLQAAASPFIPSPSPPVAPSPMIEDTKLGAGLIHNSAAGQAGQPLPANSAQTGQMGQPQAGSLAVGTPGISASPLLAEFTSPEVGQGTNLSTQVPETEKPIEKLARLMRTMPHNQLSAAVKDIASVVSMVDRIAGSAPGNGSRAAIGDDLVAMTKCRLQAKNLVHPDGGAGTSAGTSPPTKKMKRDTSAMPLNGNNNDGFSPDSVSVTDNFKASGPDTSEIQSKSTATFSNKGLKSEMHHALLEEIREINIRLIDTELTLNEEDADSTAEGGESILVKCTYTAVALSPGLRAHFTSSQLSPILPLRLLVPAGYPKCSPVILDKLLDEQRDLDDFSTRARSKFNISIRGLTQPMSLKEIAHTWDTCARKVIQEYAAQFGGGSFSSRMIKWQTINPEDPHIIV